MTNTEALHVLGNMLMRYDLTDAELEAIGIAGEALDDEWISVKDKLPEPDELVLAYHANGIEIMYTDGKRWATITDYPCWCYNVTHWRHLPKGPEKETGK